MLWQTDPIVIQAAITAWHEINLLFLILDLSKTRIITFVLNPRLLFLSKVKQERMHKRNVMPCVQKAKAKALFIRIYFRFQASPLFIKNKITSSRFFFFIF